jgi:hypothetical protein
MPNKFAEATRRNFDRTSTPKLSDDARKAVNAAFEAMSTWRNEIARKIANRSSRGWLKPRGSWDGRSRSLMPPECKWKLLPKMQIQTMDHMMDTWEEQIKSPNSSSTMLSKLTSLPNFGPVGSWPNTGAPQMAALNPFQFYMQVAQQWLAMASWTHGNTSSRA